MSKTLNREMLSKEQLEMEKNGYSFSLDLDGKIITNTTDKSIIFEKGQKVLNMTLQELLESEENFENLDFTGYKLGELLTNKFFDGNIYKELQLHRETLDIIFKMLAGGTLTEDDQLKLKELQTMGENVKIILNKF